VSEVVGFDQIIGFTTAWCSYIDTEMEKEETTQQILELVNTMQEKADADTKAYKEDLLARMDAYTKEMNAKMETNQAKATKEEEMLADISAKMNVNLRVLKEGIKLSKQK
jgi:hypothetical protein